MASFIKGTELNLALEDLIKNADEFLWFISPYIKLHDRIKDEVKRKKVNDKLRIVIVFGKNENDASKSISREDIEFLKELPNVKICYEKNLHAKYYASEDFSLITSMNLHQFSQNTNIEAGIIMQPKNAIKQLADIALSNSDAGDEALEYFEDVIKHAEVVYQKVPEYESILLGLKKKYVGSTVEVDKLNSFFNASKSDYSNTKPNSFNQYNYPKQTTRAFTPGFCIRTGIAIPFNPDKPMCYDAWKTWSQFGNLDYSEQYCHYSGEASYGETTYARPIMNKNWSKAKSYM